jgi:GNAT superfamily N-acetyltransferase
MLIERIDNPEPAVRTAILTVIDAYNDSQTGPYDSAAPFAVLLRDAAGTVIGGLWAVSYYNWMHVDLLFLPESARGAGLGRRMMRAAEREAARRGCTGIWLDTASFQAPGFYKKLGFEVFGRIEPFFHDAVRFWLLKRAPSADIPEDPALEASSTPDPTDRTKILTGLNAYNDSRIGPGDRSYFALALREAADGPILGGLHGILGRRWLFVELLVLPEGARRQGLGTTLMRQAEAVAREAGAIGVFLDTFSFQARPFYERLGYAVFGEIPDFPAPHRRFLLGRRLDGSPLNPDSFAP